MSTLPTISASENDWGRILNEHQRICQGHVAQMTVAITAAGATAIYCVPANTKLIPTQAVGRSALAITAALVCNMGVSTDIYSFLSTRSISVLAGTSVAVRWTPSSTVLTSPATHILSQTESLFISVPTAHSLSGSYLTVDIYGVLIT